MSNLSLIENGAQGQSPLCEHKLPPAGTAPSIQRLLDLISSILAEEYIAIAKRNPGVFLKQGETK